MAHDVFISYSSKDKPAADAVCAALEGHGVRCWIAPRDVIAGKAYGEALIDAINASRALVLVFSENANQSNHIAKEVERAVSKAIPIVPFRIEAVMPSKSLDYFIGSVHWLDAMTPPLESHLAQLAQSVRALLAVDRSRATDGTTWTGIARVAPPPIAPPAPPTPAPTAPAVPAPVVRRRIPRAVLIGGAVTALVVAAAAVFVLRGGLDPATKAIVGKWTWNGTVPATFLKDGTFHAGAFQGTWRVVDRDRKAYEVTWAPAVDRVALSPDGLSLAGGNQYGVKLSARRMSGNPRALPGVWSWWNGAAVQIVENGTMMAGPFVGQWSSISGDTRGYTFTWPPPIDALTLSPDGSRLQGGNQYGFPTSATRVQ